jgi:site-specific DNA-adenine methylase
MLSWYGGKGKPELSKWLFQNFDLEGINNYIEPFAGMFGIYLSKNTDFSKVKNIIYNDIDSQNGNVFHCAQMPAVFLNKINYAFKEGGMFYCANCKEYDDYYDFYKSIYDQYHKGVKKLPEVNIETRNFEAAYIYSFLRLSSMKQLHYLEAGTKKSIQDENWVKRYRFFQPLVNKLQKPKFIEKITNITEITDFDFEEVVKKYDTPESFIYLDPPYFSNEKLFDGEGKNVFTIKDHERLATAINNCKYARIAVSYYQFPGMVDLYPIPNFKYKTKEVHNSAGGQKAVEVLIMNY